jgi:hypothetical protein
MSKDTELKENVKDTLEHGLNDVLTRNIKTLLDKRRSEEKKANVEQRVVEAMTRFSGSMAFVYFNAIFFGSWLFLNLGWLGVPALRSKLRCVSGDRIGRSYFPFDIHPDFPKSDGEDCRKEG